MPFDVFNAVSNLSIGETLTRELVEKGLLNPEEQYPIPNGPAAYPHEIAAKCGSLATVKYLIDELNVSLVVKKCQSRNILYWANANPCRDVISYLTAPQFIDQFKDGSSALHVAVETNDPAGIKNSLDTHPDLLEARNIHEETALYRAARMGRMDLVATITSHKAYTSCKLPNIVNEQHRGYGEFCSAQAVGIRQQKSSDLSCIQAAINSYTMIIDPNDTDYFNLAHIYHMLAEIYYTPSVSLIVDNKAQINHAVKAFEQVIATLGNVKHPSPSVWGLLNSCYLYLAKLAQIECDFMKAEEHCKTGKEWIEKCDISTNFKFKSQYDATTLELNNILNTRQATTIAQKWGFTSVSKIDNNANSFFQTALLQIKRAECIGTAVTEKSLRDDTVEHLRKTKKYKADYLNQMSQSDYWPDENVFWAFSREFNVTLVFLHQGELRPTIRRQREPVATLYFIEQANHFQLPLLISIVR